jgi:hypothetical protein
MFIAHANGHIFVDALKGCQNIYLEGKRIGILLATGNPY